jgi:ribonuclease R
VPVFAGFYFKFMEELKERILKYIEEHPKGKRKFTDLVDAFDMHSDEDRSTLSIALDELVNEYVLFKGEGGQYQNREQAGIVEGKISINRAGMGFLDLEDRESIRIDAKSQNTALHGDTVLVKCFPWEAYGEVIRVLKRSRNHIIGTYLNTKKGLMFVPDDEKLQDKTIKVTKKEDFTPIDGMKVVCDILSYGKPMTVQVEKEIGYKDDPGVDILSVLLDHDIQPEFPEEVMEQVHGIPQEVLEEEKVGRTDLTGVNTVTIDGDSSKDFDDAVSVSRTKDGYNLKVSIADVSHYVKQGTPLDEEAWKRGCSTYVTDRVVPMLPHELSNGICSLNPHVVRLTLTCDMNVKEDGSISDYSIYPSFIRSTERMTYKNVNKILDDDKRLQKEYEHLGDMFFVLRDCADSIRRNRIKKGAIEFGSTESEIIVDVDGHPIDIRPRVRGHAEEMIEDCMIAANVCVANFMKWQEIPSVYRIHEEPQPKRIKDFVRISELLGHKLVLSKGDIHPNEIQRYLSSIENTSEYPVLSMMLLRCMSKAKYDNACVGHFGLGEEEYLHFTSPIRRYPDLVVHRMLRKYSFEQCLDLEERKLDEEKCSEAAEQSSLRERESTDAEYDCDDMKKAEYMLDHLHEKAEGIITGVQAYGFYVQLENTVEGLVSVNSLRDDYYSYDQDHMQLIGIRSHKVYQVGMKVKVTCLDANKLKGQIDFVLVGKNGKSFSERKPKRKTTSRKHVRGRRERRGSHGRKKR